MGLRARPAAGTQVWLTRIEARRVLSRSPEPLASRALQAKIDLAWFHAVENATA